MELGETAETRARRAQRAGVQWAERIVAAQPEGIVGQEGSHFAEAGDPADRGAALATEVFDRMGFDAELAAESEPSASLSVDTEQVLGRERVIRLHACPVRDLARSHPEVGCGLHLGLLQGLVDRAAAAGARADHDHHEDAAMSARLEPFVEPELCIARVAAREDPPAIEVRRRRKRGG